MRRFILGWKTLGHEKRLGAHIVNYADDFVICCRGSAKTAEAAMRSMMSRLKLTVNEEKTGIRHLPEERFDFLGYTIERCYWHRTGRSYIGTRPAKKQVQRVCRAISEMTSSRWRLRDHQDRITRLSLHRPDEPFHNSDAAVLTDGAEAGFDTAASAPVLEAVAPELATFVADNEVLWPVASLTHSATQELPHL